METTQQQIESNEFTREERIAMAEEMLLSLGGSMRLIRFIGAHSFTVKDWEVSFQFRAEAKEGYNCATIYLNPMDLYNLTLKKVIKEGTTPQTVLEKTIKDVYMDQMVDIFEAETGLFLTIQPRR